MAVGVPRPGPSPPKPADLFAACVEVGRWLPGLEAELAGCGVAVQGRASLAWLTGALRAAFDPAAWPDLAAASLDWTDAVPVAGAGGMGPLPPRQRGLGQLGVARGAPPAGRRHGPRPARGTRPLRAASVLAVSALRPSKPREGRSPGHRRADRRAWAARTRRDETQRDRDDRDRALQAAREEAADAGLGRFTLYATTIVTDDIELGAAVADVEQRAGQARLRLRRLRGAQAAGFAAALGVGVDPDDLLAVGTRR